jgi:Na+/melibiose symporter-like transporter
MAETKETYGWGEIATMVGTWLSLSISGVRILATLSGGAFRLWLTGVLLASVCFVGFLVFRHLRVKEEECEREREKHERDEKWTAMLRHCALLFVSFGVRRDGSKVIWNDGRGEVSIQDAELAQAVKEIQKGIESTE